MSRIILALSLVVSLAAQSSALSLAKANWTEVWTPNGKYSQIGGYPLTNNMGALSIAFPLATNYPKVNGDRIDYLYMVKNQPKVIAGSLVVSMRLESSPLTRFNFYFSDDPGNCNPAVSACAPALVWLLIDSQADKTIPFSYQRWWYHGEQFALVNGALPRTITAPLVPAMWSSVYGEYGNSSAAALDGWTKALKAVTQLGVTFGGGYFAGHGVNVSGGPATFSILGYSIQ